VACPGTRAAWRGGRYNQCQTDDTLMAPGKITLNGGDSSITLEGNNITLYMPATLDIKGATHAFTGPGNSPALIEGLPISTLGTPDHFIEVERRYFDETAVQGAPVKVTFNNGAVRTGKLNPEGYRVHRWADSPYL
jgi:type VI secretion system secreted protein VgrG